MPYPDALSLETVGTGAGVLSAPLRNNFAEVQAEFNDLQAFFAALASAAEGQVPIWSGGGWTVGTPATDTRYYLPAEVDVVNTTTETAIVSQIIGAGVMGTNRPLRCTVGGDFLNNGGAAASFTLRIKLGATTLYADASPSYGPDADRTPWFLQFYIGNQNSASVQRLGGFFHLGSENELAATGTGGIGVEGRIHNPIRGTSAIDTASAATLEVTVQNSAAHASVSFRKDYAVIEIV